MDETKCYYLSSHGIKKVAKLYIETLTEYDLTMLKERDILFIKIDMVNYLPHYLAKINVPIIIVTGCGDYTLPWDRINQDDFLSLLENKKIIHWFAHNCHYNHPKLTSIPIGLDYHTLNFYHYNHPWGINSTPQHQEQELICIKNSAKPFWQRIAKCYSNYHFAIYPQSRYGQDRLDALSQIPTEIVYYEREKITRKQTWQNQINYTFVLSPMGNGADCHRTWEALALGCIPIVKKSFLDVLYQDLPVLIVDNWYDIDEKLLYNTIEKFKNQKFNLDKLKLQYWLEKIINIS